MTVNLVNPENAFTKASAHIVEQVLRTDGSIFEPTTPLWSLNNLTSVLELLPTSAEDRTKFTDILFQRLQTASSVQVKLTGELVWFFLLALNMGTNDKLALLDQIFWYLDRAPKASRLHIPQTLIAALAPPNESASQSLRFQLHHTQRSGLIHWLATVLLKWKSLDESERYEFLSGPHAFDRYLERFDAVDEGPELRFMRNALLGVVSIGALYSPIVDIDASNPKLSESFDTELLEIAERLLIRPDYLVRISQLVKRQRQVIFYGPPGTGKTFVAREMAGYFARDGGDVKIVQFHPSYAYEDFIEGLRPVEVDGETRFRVVDGPLKRIAEQARQTPEATHVLLIDEINRGNLSKVLGELYFLLEYRDEAITLQYSDDEFSLPENLWIIGTMNTADRSIALVDAALRRRFFFVGFFPDEEPIDGLLRRWLGRHNPDYLWVADIVDEANRRLDDRHLAIGPSYFMKDNLDEEWLEIIWEHQVIPYLAEQFFGEEARLDEFHLKNLRRQPEIAVDETPDAVAE